MRYSIGRTIAIKKRRAALQNHDFSIISNTCIGGVISHSVGEQFRSPTVNLIIYEKEFITFCTHLREYAKCPVALPNEMERERYQNIDYPVGILRGGELPDITLYFVHYHSFEEAKEKWEERFRRVNYDNLYILMDRGMDAKEEILEQFHSLPYEHKVFFTDKEDLERWPNTFRFHYYTKDLYKNGYMYTAKKKGLAEYRVLDEFDYVKWLNDGSICRSNIFD